MPILLPEKSLAKNNLDAMDLWNYRKVYKDNVLKDFDSVNPSPGTADFWYDRNLYGILDRRGNIIVSRESLLSTLRTRDSKTYFALDFVAVAFDQFMIYVYEQLRSNNVPNQNTIFRAISPKRAWKPVYEDYNKSMEALFEMFTIHLEVRSIESRVNNFKEFVEEFFLFVRDFIMSNGSTVTFSGFVSNPKNSNFNNGLIIDIAKDNADDDALKENKYINDINFDFYRKAANRFGFAVDRNIPWRLVANLNSKPMQTIMSNPAFDVTYGYGAKNIFDKYYTKTYTLDLPYFRDYMYGMYLSLLQYRPSYIKTVTKECPKNRENPSILINKSIKRDDLTDEVKESLTIRDYWLETVFRLRLMEVPHGLGEANIRYAIKKAKTVYDQRGQTAALTFLHRITKKFFLNSVNL